MTASCSSLSAACICSLFMIQVSVGPLPVNVADQAVELVSDLSQVGFNTSLIFFAEDAEFTELVKHLGLPLFDVSHHNDGILQFLDCRLHCLVAHDSILRLTAIIVYMDAIEFLQSWYRAQTNGEWEHSRGVTIETLDNPGWRVTIDLVETPLEGASMRAVRREKSVQDWLVCEVDHDQFRGNGDPRKLLTILQVFQSWVEEAAKVK
jgi:hypothetical protein